MDWEVKKPFSSQSKYGLMGSSAKIGKNFIRGSQGQKYVLFWVQNIKVPFQIGQPPPTHQT